MKTIDIDEIVTEQVKKYIDNSREIYLSNPEDMDHLLNISVSIILTKENILQGGSFVQAIVNNDLYMASIKADNFNKQYIWFYSKLCNDIQLE